VVFQRLILRIDPPTVIDRIGQQRQVKIAVYERDNVIRITADRLAAQYAVEDIQKTLKHTVKRIFDLEPFNAFAPEKAQKGALQHRAVDMIAKLSGTVIQTIGDTKVSFILQKLLKQWLIISAIDTSNKDGSC